MWALLSSHGPVTGWGLPWRMVASLKRWGWSGVTHSGTRSVTALLGTVCLMKGDLSGVPHSAMPPRRMSSSPLLTQPLWSTFRDSYPVPSSEMPSYLGFCISIFSWFSSNIAGCCFWEFCATWPLYEDVAFICWCCPSLVLRPLLHVLAQVISPTPMAYITIPI